MSGVPHQPIKVFLSYSHQDLPYRDKIKAHLALLEHEGKIESWSDQQIGPGEDWREAIGTQLEQANLILVLLSADFFASKYCFNVELNRAVERHMTGEARIIPIIVRHCEWKWKPLEKMQALPPGGRPIASYSDPDEPLLLIAEAIRAEVDGRAGGEHGPAPRARRWIWWAVGAAALAAGAVGYVASTACQDLFYLEAMAGAGGEQSVCLNQIRARWGGCPTNLPRASITSKSRGEHSIVDNCATFSPTDGVIRITYTCENATCWEVRAGSGGTAKVKTCVK